MGASSNSFGSLASDGQTDQAPRVGRHEVDRFRGDHLRSHRDVPFVFAIFVVYDHYHTPGSEIFNRIIYRCKHA
jgi:hypothetical protein